MDEVLQITGSTGFVGQNLINYLKSVDGLQFILTTRQQLLQPEIKDNIYAVIHLSGKAHDLKNVSDPKEYYEVNTDLTKKVYNAFLASKARVFITLSSVKAVADKVEGELTEEQEPIPVTHYGKSKLLAEQYIFSKSIPEGKRVYV